MKKGGRFTLWLFVGLCTSTGLLSWYENPVVGNSAVEVVVLAVVKQLIELKHFHWKIIMRIEKICTYPISSLMRLILDLNNNFSSDTRSMTIEFVESIVSSIIRLPWNTVLILINFLSLVWQPMRTILPNDYEVYLTFITSYSSCSK